MAVLCGAARLFPCKIRSGFRGGLGRGGGRPLRYGVWRARLLRGGVWSLPRFSCCRRGSTIRRLRGYGAAGRDLSARDVVSRNPHYCSSRSDQRAQDQKQTASPLKLHTHERIM